MRFGGGGFGIGSECTFLNLTSDCGICATGVFSSTSWWRCVAENFLPFLGGSIGSHGGRDVAHLRFLAFRVWVEGILLGRAEAMLSVTISSVEKCH